MIAGQDPQLGEKREKDSPPEPSEGTDTANTLISYLQSLER